MRISLITLLFFTVIIGIVQAQLARVRDTIDAKDVAELGHCYIATDNGAEWHSLRTCPNLLHSGLGAIKYVPYETAIELGDGTKWHTHCEVCRRILAEGLAAGDFRNPAERSRVTAMAIADNTPPQPVVAPPRIATPPVEPIEDEPTVMPPPLPNPDAPEETVDEIKVVDEPVAAPDLVEAKAEEEEFVVVEEKPKVREILNRYNTYEKYRRPKTSYRVCCCSR